MVDSLEDIELNIFKFISLSYIYKMNNRIRYMEVKRQYEQYVEYTYDLMRIAYHLGPERNEREIE